MNACALRVVKLGGSLLEWPAWPERLQAWLAAQPPASGVLVVGGGKLVDVVRKWDATHTLSASAAHWLAIRGMSLTAQLAAERLPQSTLVRELKDIHRGAGERIQILDCEGFLRSEPAGALPHGWHVTSDSIAAHVARALAASELVLLKSALPAADEAGAMDYVDGYFAEAARGLTVRFVDLRDPKFAEATW